MLEKIPNGLVEIKKTFGDPADPSFEKENIILFDLPYPMRYGDIAVKRSRGHRLAVEHFIGALTVVRELIDAHEIELYQCDEYGGIYNFRAKRGNPMPSTHCWGIAIDLEAVTMRRGTDLRLPQPVIDAFAKFGFAYGGDFHGVKDPMHFQLALGY